MIRAVGAACRIKQSRGAGITKLASYTPSAIEKELGGGGGSVSRTQHRGSENPSRTGGRA